MNQASDICLRPQIFNLLKGCVLICVKCVSVENINDARQLNFNVCSRD